jgi:cyclohexadienyl dehydratase
MVRIVVGLLTGLLLISSAQAQQASRLDEIIKRGTLRVGTTGDYRPFSYFDKTTSTFTGLDIDMAQGLGKALGVKVEFVQTAWPQLKGL